MILPGSLTCEMNSICSHLLNKYTWMSPISPTIAFTLLTLLLITLISSECHTPRLQHGLGGRNLVSTVCASLRRLAIDVCGRSCSWFTIMAGSSSSSLLYSDLQGGPPPSAETIGSGDYRRSVYLGSCRTPSLRWQLSADRCEFSVCHILPYDGTARGWWMDRA